MGCSKNVTHTHTHTPGNSQSHLVVHPYMQSGATFSALTLSDLAIPAAVLAALAYSLAARRVFQNNTSDSVLTKFGRIKETIMPLFHELNWPKVLYIWIILRRINPTTADMNVNSRRQFCSAAVLTLIVAATRRVVLRWATARFRCWLLRA